MLLKSLVLISFFFLNSFSSIANDDIATSLSFGPVIIGEDRIPIEFSDFVFEKKMDEDAPEVRLDWYRESLQWVRLKNSMLLPRARLSFRIFHNASEIQLHYSDKNLLLQQSSDGWARAEIYISLFLPAPIEVFKHGKKIGEINITVKSGKNENRHLIDYSCAPYELEIIGLSEEYISAGCHISYTQFKKEERALLEINWVATNTRLVMNNASPPFTAQLIEDAPIHATVIDTKNGAIKTVVLKAQMPSYSGRLRAGVAMGPAEFRSNKNANDKNDIWSPSVALLAAWSLRPGSEIKVFDYFVIHRSFFNTLGPYYSAQLSSFFDNRFEIGTLIGGQIITYRHSENSGYFHQFILPQGLELTYKHAFSIKNTSLRLGMLLLPSTQDSKYSNYWLRFGKNIYVEFNYLTWKREEQTAKMVGVSLGVPLFSLF